MMTRPHTAINITNSNGGRFISTPTRAQTTAPAYSFAGAIVRHTLTATRVQPSRISTDGLTKLMDIG